MKVAILSCESSHAEAFSKIINVQFLGVIQSVWDADQTIANAKKISTGAATNSAKLEENLDQVDFVLVEGRYADSHFLPAKKALEQGIPVYIDKPTTASYEEALELERLANEQKVPLTSFTPIIMSSDFQEFQKKTEGFKIFHVGCPAYCRTINHPKAKDLSFYASHGTDLLTRLISSQPLTVISKRNASAIFVMIEFEDNYIGTLHFPLVSDEFYHITAVNAHFSESVAINPYGDMYENTVKHLFKNFLKTGWTEKQFKPSINSMWILDQIKLQVKA